VENPSANSTYENYDGYGYDPYYDYSGDYYYYYGEEYYDYTGVLSEPEGNQQPFRNNYN